MIKTKELLKILKILSPGLASKELVEQSTSFTFMDDTVISYNDEVALSHAFKCKEFSGVVPGKELCSVLEKIKDEEISFKTLKESSELLIEGKKVKVAIRFQPDIKLAIENIKPGRWLKLPINFMEGLKICIFSASRDTSKPILTAINIDSNKIESCDNFHLTRYIMDSEIRLPFMLSSKVVQELIKYTPESYSIVDSWAHFKIGNNCVFSCRMIEGEYPYLDPLLEIKKSHTLRFPNDMKEMLERASVALSEDQDQIKINLNEGRLTVKSENNIIRFEETARIRSDKDELTFIINPKHLVEILKYTSEAQIDNDISKLKFINDDFEYVIALSIG